jgi:hypothetical protein
MDWGRCLGGVILSIPCPPRANKGSLTSSNSCSSSSLSVSSAGRLTNGGDSVGDDDDDNDEEGSRGTEIFIRGVLVDNDILLRTKRMMAKAVRVGHHGMKNVRHFAGHEGVDAGLK